MRVGIDVGATGMCSAAKTADGRRLEPKRLGDTSARFKEGIAMMVRELDRLESLEPVTDVAIAVAGRLTPDRRGVAGAGTLTGWIDKPLADALEEAVPWVRNWYFANDAEAQALWEVREGNNPLLPSGKDSLFYGVGTGVAVARVTWVNGQPVSLPTEGCHLPASMPDRFPNPKRCGCGRTNCFERLCSGSGAEQRFGQPADQLTADQWKLVAYDQARHLAALLTTHLVDTVVYGGGVAEHQRQMLVLVQRFLEKEAIAGMTATLVPAMGTKLGGGEAALALIP